MAQATCIFSGCDKKVRAKGLCAGHHQQKAKGKELTPLRKVHPTNYAAGTKQCNGCEEEKPLSEFYKKGKYFAAYCKKCEPIRARERQLSLYGLTQEAFDSLFERQGKVCGSCGTTDPGRQWCVDHDHSCCPSDRTCGKCVRGILCYPCNMGIGLLGDTAGAVEKALLYLKRFESRQV